MVKVYFEGSTNEDNGKLRIGFARLFEQRLKGKMPRFIPGKGQNETIDIFKKDSSVDKKYLLIDLDKAESERQEATKELKLHDYAESAFFMIQKMEAWILSQPQVIDDYYGKGISEKLAKKHAKEFSNPSIELENITKNTQKGKYHKIKDASALLPKLDLSKLESDFEDVKNLIKALS